jgi:hypothetical protein
MMLANRKTVGFLASVVLILLASQPLSAQGLEETDQEPESFDQESRPGFGGPDAVQNLLESNRA